MQRLGRAIGETARNAVKQFRGEPSQGVEDKYHAVLRQRIRKEALAEEDRIHRLRHRRDEGTDEPE